MAHKPERRCGFKLSWRKGHWQPASSANADKPLRQGMVCTYLSARKNKKLRTFQGTLALKKCWAGLYFSIYCNFSAETDTQSQGLREDFANITQIYLWTWTNKHLETNQIQHLHCILSVPTLLIFTVSLHENLSLLRTIPLKAPVWQPTQNILLQWKY